VVIHAILATRPGETARAYGWDTTELQGNFGGR